jgi:hypothetical protein
MGTKTCMPQAQILDVIHSVKYALRRHFTGGTPRSLQILLHNRS